MKILELAPLWETVPPPAYGGTEAIVSLLSDGLAQAGHDVTLFASGDSKTLAKLHSVYPRSLRTAYDLKDRTPYDCLHNAIALCEAKGFDIVHNHAGELAMAMSHLIKTPMLSTMHCLITPDTKIVWDHYPWFYNTISHAQRLSMPEIENKNFVGVVHNAIDVETFPFSVEKDDYLLFLARICPEKGTHHAIEVARILGKKLLIAGKVDQVDRTYFEKEIKPEIDGRQIQFLGEADAEEKRALYAKAYCLLAPICWEEPFGLFLIEAMACGTPVIAFAKGAAPEIIVHGRTGYLVHDVEQMAKAAYLVDQIDPHHCREHVKRNFDKHRMVRDYLATYEEVLNLSTVIAEGHRVFSLPLHDVSPKPCFIEEPSMNSSVPLVQDASPGISKDDSVGANTVTTHLDKCVKAEQNGLRATQASKN
jgi:glycosyltransferase involved in cell wall biosynthesis